MLGMRHMVESLDAFTGHYETTPGNVYDRTLLLPTILMPPDIVENAWEVAQDFVRSICFQNHKKSHHLVV